MKPHIKVIQRNGVDIFVTSSMKDKSTVSEKQLLNTRQWDCTIDYGDNHPLYQGINNDPGIGLTSPYDSAIELSRSLFLAGLK